MTQGDLDNTLPVIAKALALSEDEVVAIRQANRKGVLRALGLRS